MRPYSALIVDDEELALQGLELGIDWTGLNIHRLYKARCMDEAGRLLEQERDGGPDDTEDMENSAQIVAQVKKLIAENLSEGNLQRDELAAMVHISPGYLGRIFKKGTGMSLTDYIIKRRITVAKQLLAKTSLSVTRVSERVGITYSSYFYKSSLMTPQEYRQKNQ